MDRQTLLQLSYVLLFLSVTSVFYFWVPSNRAGENFFAFRLGEMWKLNSRSRQGLWIRSSLLLACCYLFKDIFYPSFESFLPPVPTCFLLAIAIVHAGGRCTPPTVLFLSASGNLSFGVVAKIKSSLSPYRLFYLLKGTGEDFSDDNGRTIDGAHWRDTVHRLVVISPVILVDTRVVTPAVQEEIGKLFVDGCMYKTLFIVDPDNHFDFKGLCARLNIECCIPEIHVTSWPNSVDNVKFIIRQQINRKRLVNRMIRQM